MVTKADGTPTSLCVVCGKLSVMSPNSSIKCFTHCSDVHPDRTEESSLVLPQNNQNKKRVGDHHVECKNYDNCDDDDYDLMTMTLTIMMMTTSMTMMTVLLLLLMMVMMMAKILMMMTMTTTMMMMMTMGKGGSWRTSLCVAERSTSLPASSLS